MKGCYSSLFFFFFSLGSFISFSFLSSDSSSLFSPILPLPLFPQPLFCFLLRFIFLLFPLCLLFVCLQGDKLLPSNNSSSKIEMIRWCDQPEVQHFSFIVSEQAHVEWALYSNYVHCHASLTHLYYFKRNHTKLTLYSCTFAQRQQPLFVFCNFCLRATCLVWFLIWWC